MNSLHRFALTSFYFKGELAMKASIKSHLKSDIEIIYLESVDSTNTYAKNLLRSGKENDFLVVACEQTAGRGRQGKSFYSPYKKGIYMSLATRPNAPLENVITATTAASVGVCRAIEELTDKKPEIKWVNDVYLQGKKLCGILTECISGAGGIASGLVIGVGINVEAVGFPSDVENAVSLGENVDKAALTAKIADNLLELAHSDYPDFIDYYRAHSLVIGKKINCIENGKITPATAIDIDDRGGLAVRYENGDCDVLRTGEISIRLA